MFKYIFLFVKSSAFIFSPQNSYMSAMPSLFTYQSEKIRVQYQVSSISQFHIPINYDSVAVEPYRKTASLPSARKASVLFGDSRVRDHI